MRLDRLLRSLEDHLSPLIAADGGRLDVADSEVDALEMLVAGGPPGRYRVVMVPMGGAASEADELAGITEDTVALYVQTHRGLGATSGQGLHRDRPGGSVAFLTLKDALIRWVRSLYLNDAEVGGWTDGGRFEFRRWDWARMDKEPIRAAVLEFAIHYALDDPAAAVLNVTPTGAVAGGVLAWQDGVGLTYTRGGVVYDFQLFPRSDSTPVPDDGAPSGIAVAFGGGELDWEDGVGLIYRRAGVVYDLQLFPRS